MIKMHEGGGGGGGGGETFAHVWPIQISRRVLNTFTMHGNRMLNLNVERETKHVQGKESTIKLSVFGKKTV